MEEDKNTKSNFWDRLLKFAVIFIILLGLSYWRACNKKNIMNNAYIDNKERLNLT